MAGVPEMWRNQGNIHSRNTIVSPYGLEKQNNGRNPPLIVPTPLPDANGNDSLCFSPDRVKPVDKQSQVCNSKSGSGEHQRETKHVSTVRQHYNPVNIRLLNGLKQHSLTEKTFPCMKGLKFVRDECVSNDLTHWKQADKEDPPVRTLFRAKRWIDSDEQGCKRVNCVLECEKIDSKYCSCSRKRIGVSVVKRNNVIFPNQDVMCSCLNQKKQENLKLIIGNKMVENPEIDGPCLSKNENGNGLVHCHSRNENCHQNHNKKQLSSNVCDLETVRVSTVKSSKCVYLKHGGGSSYITANNQVMLHNSSYCVPSHTHPAGTVSKLVAYNVPVVPARGPPAQSYTLEQFHRERYPVDSRLFTEQSNMMGDQAGKLKEPRQKLMPEEFGGEDIMTLRKDLKPGDYVSHDGKKEPKTVLDVLEVDTLEKANNILEKIACTLDQIKVLSQSTLPQGSVKQFIEGKKLKKEDIVREKIENLKGLYTDNSIGKERKQKDTKNICTENEAITSARNEEKKFDRPITEEAFCDDNQKMGENVDPKKKYPSIDTRSDDLNAIPLKITKAVSAFKTVETSAVYSCKLYATQELQDNQEAKKSHSINIISQIEVGQKKNVVTSLLKMPPDHKASEETGKESTCPPKKASLQDNADALVFSPSSKERNLRMSPNEGSNQKKMTNAALRSVLENAISPRPSSMKDSVELSIKGSPTRLFPTSNNYISMHHSFLRDEGKIGATKIKSPANQNQPSTQSRLSSLAQPKASYIKALKREFQNFMDKPMIERLNRLIEPLEKLQSPMLSNSKPPIHPSRNPSPKKSGTPVRNRSADGGQKQNTLTDTSLKKPQYRPKTTPNKVRDEVTSRQGSPTTKFSEPLEKRMNNGRHTPGVGSTRPATVSNVHQSQGGTSFWGLSHSGDGGQELLQLDDSTKVCVPECEQSGRKRNQRSREPTRLGLTVSESSKPDRNLEDEENYRCRRKKSLTDDLGEEASPSKRLRARTCMRRTGGIIHPRRRRFATCCFPLIPDPKYLSTDLFKSNRSEGPENLNQTDAKKECQDGSVNVSLTLKNESMDASKQTTEEVLVKSSKEANNQIIFNVYQMTPDKLASDRKDESSERNSQRREEGNMSTPRPEKEIAKAPSQKRVVKGISKSHVEILDRPGVLDIKGYDRPSSPIHASVGVSEEGGPNRGYTEDSCPTRPMALLCKKDGRPMEEPWGNREHLMLPQEQPQYRIMPCQEHLASFDKGYLPFAVKTVICDCCGRDDSSNVSRAFTSSGNTEPRTISSAPSLDVSDSYPELCIGCHRIVRTSPNLKLRRGKPLLRPLRDISLQMLRHREAVRRGENYGEESLHLSQPLGDIPSLGMIRDWLRDSNVDVRRWSSELTFKVDVGTSVSGFHVAKPSLGGARGHRKVICATGEEAERKDVVCTAKRSSVTVILKKNYFQLDRSKKADRKKRRKSAPSRTLSEVSNANHRKILVMTSVCFCLFTFLGWVVLLPSYYI